MKSANSLQPINIFGVSMARKKNISAVLRKRNAQTSELKVMKKGMELPVNTLVVVAIAVIVILAIAAFFMGGFGGSSKDIQNRQTFLNACGSWVQTGCNNADYDTSIEQAFSVWQPNVDLENTPTGQSKIDYLASKCGCFGSGSGGRSSTCSSYADQTSCNGQTNCGWSSNQCESLNDAIAGTCEGVKGQGKKGVCTTATLCSGAAKTNLGQYDCPATKPECCKTT